MAKIAFRVCRSHIFPSVSRFAEESQGSSSRTSKTSWGRINGEQATYQLSLFSGGKTLENTVPGGKTRFICA